MKNGFCSFKSRCFQCIEIRLWQHVAVIWKAPKLYAYVILASELPQEDLPRIFLKRATQDITEEAIKSQWYWTYLCRRICRNLGHTITGQILRWEAVQ